MGLLLTVPVQAETKSDSENLIIEQLAGSDGLTVVRRPRVEEDYKIEKIYEEWN